MKFIDTGIILVELCLLETCRSIEGVIEDLTKEDHREYNIAKIEEDVLKSGVKRCKSCNFWHYDFELDNDICDQCSLKS